MPALFVVLFIVTFFPMILAFIGGYLRYKHVDNFDNRHPREQQAELTGVAARILAAQKNAWEALIFYSAVTPAGILFQCKFTGTEWSRHPVLSLPRFASNLLRVRFGSFP